MAPVLRVDRLSVRLGHTAVLRDISFELDRGASLAIIGPNGAGKTVLLRALAGSLPFTGSVRWADDVRLGYVPQKLDLARDVPITGLDFLSARLRLAHRKASAAADVLASVDLSVAAARMPIGALSGGQFQRLLVAFALAGDPSVLLLDEPTAGVDDPGQTRLNELVSELQRDRALTVLLVSHDLSVVYQHATHVLCLSQRRACAFGPPRDILTPELLRDLYGSPVAFHIHDH